MAVEWLEAHAGTKEQETVLHARVIWNWAKPTTKF